MGEKKKLTLKEIGTDKLILIGVSGIALILLSFPTGSKKKESDNSAIVSTETGAEDYYTETEKRLENIIEKIDGVDSAEVMITLKGTGEKVVLKDNPYEKEKSKDEERYVYSDSSVIVENSQGDSAPYVIKEIEPEIEGIAVVYTGKESGDVAYKITNVIKALFDIESHKISVVEQ